MRAELIFTGTELLTGQVLNTHSQYLGQQLKHLGIKVVLQTTVGDSWQYMGEVLRQAINRSDLIITTGGLGPTADDLTKEIIAKVTELPLLFNEKVLDDMKSYFVKRNMSMPESITKQAYFPDGAKILTNPVGTAPGVLLEYQGKLIICLPGPPFELIPTFEDSVISYLKKISGRGKVSKSRLFKLTGIAESIVQDRLKDFCEKEYPDIAFLAKPGEVHVRITDEDVDSQKAQESVNELSKKVHIRLENYIFGLDDEVLEEVVGGLLAKRGLTIALAESCTGGLIAARLTEIPGSSRYLLGGVVAYDNKVKEKVLAVPSNILKIQGAVSEQTAAAMARGVQKLIGADIGLAVTGIAGPGGGTQQKPQGLVYICMATSEGINCKKFNFTGERKAVRQGTANAALNMVRQFLLDKSKIKRSKT